MKRYAVIMAGILAVAVIPGMVVGGVFWRVPPPLDVLLSWVSMVTYLLPELPFVTGPCLLAIAASALGWVIMPCRVTFACFALVATLCGPVMWHVVMTSGFN